MVFQNHLTADLITFTEEIEMEIFIFSAVEKLAIQKDSSTLVSDIIKISILSLIISAH